MVLPAIRRPRLASHPRCRRAPFATATKPININMHVAGSGIGTAMMLPDEGGPSPDALPTPKESNREAANPPPFT